MLTLSLRKRNNSKQKTSKFDELLDAVGLLRHVVPKDGNSLFRCISQCVFFTQSYHLAVRKHLLQFSTLQTEEFSQMTEWSLNKYAKKITDTKLDGEFLDLRIAAKFYKINIVFYVDKHPFEPIIIETPNSVKTLNICFNYDGTYDLVLTKQALVNISFCQTIIYNMLYKDVFKLSDVDFAVNEMLFKRNVPVRSNDEKSLEKRAICTDMKELLENGIIPFPFKVAKALTPNLYRNTEYDIWLNNKKEKFLGKHNNWEFKEGSQCMVLIGNEWCYCYIQSIRGKNEPVEVYVKDLAKKMLVNFTQLKLITAEYDVRDKIDSHLQVDKVSSFTDMENGLNSEVSEQHQSPVQFNNPDFFHRPAVHEVLPSQVFPSSGYVYQYQYRPAMILPNSINNGNVMVPWYISTMSPPILSNNVWPMRVTASPNLPSVSPCWYCSHNSTSIPCNCVQYNNNEESGVTMDSNHAYQPCLMPEFDVPADELQ